MRGAGGFHIPSHMIESGASGLQLVHWVRGVWGTRDPESEPTAAVVKLGGWIMGEPGERTEQIEALQISLADVLGDRLPVHPVVALDIAKVTGGAIGLLDWTRPYSEASISAAADPQTGMAAEGGAAASLGALPPAEPSLSAGSAAAPPIIHGLVGGQCPQGRLFRCLPGPGDNVVTLTGFGASYALPREVAAAIVETLAQALGISVVVPARWPKP